MQALMRYYRCNTLIVDFNDFPVTASIFLAIMASYELTTAYYSIKRVRKCLGLR